MDNQICRHYFITGRVQGVSFRYYARQQARHLGVSGWAHNLVDGRVEILACGSKKAVDHFYAWLQDGPSLAQVTNVQSQAVDNFDCPISFEIG